MIVDTSAFLRAAEQVAREIHADTAFRGTPLEMRSFYIHLFTAGTDARQLTPAMQVKQEEGADEQSLPTSTCQTSVHLSLCTFRPRHCADAADPAGRDQAGAG